VQEIADAYAAERARSPAEAKAVHEMVTDDIFG
jgi:hypothetical protein